MNTDSSVQGHAASNKAAVWFQKGYWPYGICAAAYILPFMRVLWPGGDEGSIVYDAVRVVHGQVFARDFFEVMGPGSIYWAAAFFKLFGISFFAARISLFVSSFGIALLMYFLTRRVYRSYCVLPGMILAGTVFSSLWPASGHHVDSTFFALLAVACLVSWRISQSRIALFAGGVAAALTLLTHQPKGLLLLFAILLWTLLQRTDGPKRYWAAATILLGFLCAMGVALIYFWMNGAIQALFYANFVWPLLHYGTVNRVPYAHNVLNMFWDRWIKSGIPVWTSAILICPFFLIVALPALLALAVLSQSFHRRLTWRDAPPELMLYLLGGVAIWLSEIHRMDIIHLVFGSPLLLIVALYPLTLTKNLWSKLARQLLATTTGLLLVFNLLCVLMAHTVVTRVGTVAAIKDDPGLTFLSTHVTPGENTFIYPWLPMDYFLSSTTNPTRYSILTYNYNTDAEFVDATESLERSKPIYVLWDVGFFAKYAEDLPNSFHRSPRDLIMENYLQAHYTTIETDGTTHIMKRNQEPRAN